MHRAFLLLALTFFGTVLLQAEPPSEFARTTRFKSPEEFEASAKAFIPAKAHTEFGFLFSAPEMGNDDATYGQTKFANEVDKVEVLWRGKDFCAYLIKADPHTDYTKTYVALLMTLAMSPDGNWRITAAERFEAGGVGGWIECKVLQQPEKKDAAYEDQKPLIFRVTEIDAGRQKELARRNYTLSANGGGRYSPVSPP